MFLQNKPVLLSDASVIRHETADRHNTAERVGSLLIDIINSIDATFTAVDAYIQDLVSEAVANIPGNSGGGNINIDLSSYATRTWVESQKYLKTHQDISHLLPKQTFDSMFELVTPDEGAPYIRAKLDLLGDGRITAKNWSRGGGLGSGSGAADRLADLLDVELSPLSNGQMLVYRNGRWVNESVAYGGGGLNESELASYLSRYGYVTNSALGNYMTLNTQQTITAVKVFAEEVRFIGNGTYSDPAVGVRCGLKSQLPIATGGFIKAGGTSAQFLKADGSVDSNVYLPRYFSYLTAGATQTYVDWLKERGSIALYAPNNWCWAQAGNITTPWGTNINSHAYSALTFREGNLNYSWAMTATMFLPAYCQNDVSGTSTYIYIAQAVTTDTAGKIVGSRMLRYADYDTVLASNVASATKLQTERSIFGNMFNGLADVTGPRVMVNGVNTAGSYPNIMFHIPNVGYTQIQMDGSGTLYVRDGGNQAGALKNFYAGSFYSTGWFRSVGNNGWYNETYGGGIYQDSANWVKLYQKPLYIGTLRNIGANHFNVALKMENSSNMGFECQGGNYVMGMGCHNNGSWYWWRGTNGETVANKSYVMQFDGTVWSFTGNILTSGKIAGTNTSDIRLKENVFPVKHAAEMLRGLGGFFTFDYKPGVADDDRAGHIGLIWQNVQGHFANLMSLRRPDGYGALNYLCVDYINLIGAATLENSNEIEVLKNRIEKLERRCGCNVD